MLQLRCSDYIVDTWQCGESLAFWECSCSDRCTCVRWVHTGLKRTSPSSPRSSFSHFVGSRWASCSSTSAPPRARLTWWCTFSDIPTTFWSTNVQSTSYPQVVQSYISKIKSELFFENINVCICSTIMTVPVEIKVEDENNNYRMFLQRNDNMVQVAAKQQVSFRLSNINNINPWLSDKLPFILA